MSRWENSDLLSGRRGALLSPFVRKMAAAQVEGGEMGRFDDLGGLFSAPVNQQKSHSKCKNR